MSQDPLGFAAGDGNLYRYVAGNPTTATDPSGTIEDLQDPRTGTIKLDDSRLMEIIDIID